MNGIPDNDYVIVRNDGVIITNEIGTYRLFTSKDTRAVDNAIGKLNEICKRIKAPYSFTPVKYNDLPEDKKYK